MRAKGLCAVLLRNFSSFPIVIPKLHNPHTMAKRKTQKDPEELPDAPASAGKGKRKNAADDSDSDSVIQLLPYCL